MTADEERNTSDSFPVAVKLKKPILQPGAKTILTSIATDAVIIQKRSLSCVLYSEAFFLMDQWCSFRFGEGCVGFGRQR